MSEIDVFICNYTLVDPEIYQLWIDGLSATEAVKTLNLNGLGLATGASLELIASDVLDHYRTYSLLEKLLCNPNKLQEQSEFQIEPQTRRLLIEKYYDFDGSVMRELLGKKLSSKHRKDLDEVSEKTKVSLKSCRRQFDNVKRVFKVVEEMPGSLVQNIQKAFCLPEELARRYACVVFLACLRFETSKRRLQHMNFSAFKKCTEIIMENWTYPLQLNTEYYDTEMDKEFLTDLRDLRVLAEKEKEHKHLVCTSLRPTFLQKSYSELESNFKFYWRAILALAAALHRTREMRNLFIDLSQITELWKHSGWSPHDLEIFLNAFTKCALELDIREENFRKTWERYMKGPKKKLTRAERNRLEMERLEQARILAEMETQRAIEEQRRKLELERKLATEKEKKETAEQALRVEQLTNSNILIKSMSDYNWNINRREKDDFEWKQYLKCDGLPDATKPSQMSTYLHLWKQVIQDVTVEEAKCRTAEIIAVLEDIIADPFDAKATMIENWKWIRNVCREQQHENLNAVTYRLLRDIDSRLNHPEIPRAEFTVIDENFVICLWLSVVLAVPMHNPRAPAKKRLEIHFPETRLNILFPTVLNPKNIVIRTIYVKYDHLSDNCDTYDKPSMSPDVDKDLFEATAQEWYVKMKYKWNNRNQSITKLDETKDGGLIEVSNGGEAASEWKGNDVPPAVPYKKLDPTASRYAICLEGKKKYITQE